MKYYRRLRDIREDKDMKQSDVAKILGITRQQYQLYECGEREMLFHLFIDFSKHFNVSLDYIAELTNDKRGLTRSELSAEETELIKKYRSLSEKRQGKLLGQLELLEEQQAEETAHTREAI